MQSVFLMEEGEGFEPSVGCPTIVFKTIPFNRSGIPPFDREMIYKKEVIVNLAILCGIRGRLDCFLLRCARFSLRSSRIHTSMISLPLIGLLFFQASPS